MLSHYLQRQIIYTLSFVDHLRFSDLKPDDIENKLFTYHLKKVVSTGLVVKTDDNKYALSPEGRRISTGVGTAEQTLITERPYSVLFLVIRRKYDGAWLLYTRPIHPMRGYTGFMHANPTSGLDVAEAAHAQCYEKTGLRGSFTALGGGYFRIFKGSELESFTHFTLLACDDIEGDITRNQDSYQWANQLKLDDARAFPGTRDLYAAYTNGQPFFMERTFQLNAE